MKLRMILGLTAALAMASISMAKGPTSLMGKTVPAFSMLSITGEKITDKTLRGKVVVLDFWATWCGPCIQASPAMDKLQRKFKAQGLRVIGANVMEQNLKGAKEYTKKHGYTYTTTLNNDKIAQQWGLTGIPMIMIIGKDGKVAKVYEGYGPGLEKDMEAVIAKLIK